MFAQHIHLASCAHGHATAFAFYGEFNGSTKIHQVEAHIGGCFEGGFYALSVCDVNEDGLIVHEG